MLAAAMAVVPAEDLSDLGEIRVYVDRLQFFGHDPCDGLILPQSRHVVSCLLRSFVRGEATGWEPRLAVG